MDWLAQIETQFGVLIVNPAKSVEACVDKYLSLERVRAIRIPVPATFVCQSAAEAMRFFRDAARDCVVKPIFGSRGRNIARVKTESQALTLFEQLESQGKVIYQQRYIEHGDRDLRLLVIGNQLVSMVRRLPGSWITNASLGAHCTPHTANELERSIAWRAADSVGAVLAGIDLVYDQNGNPFVVEINASPSWRAISKATATDVASMLIQWMEKKVQ
jgi:ribosomal protein S6--L-glutamate ligase